MKEAKNSANSANSRSWPERTWFQERLSAVKDQKYQLRRRPMVSPHKEGDLIAKPSEERQTDESS